MTIYALIPARGGSKRLPNKNIELLLGKPLIYFSLDIALAQVFFEKVVVSTDSHIIIDYLYEYDDERIEVLIRPTDLATDTATMNSVIEHFIGTYNLAQDDVIVVMYPTSPFRNYVADAVKYFLKNNGKSLQTVTKLQSKPFGGLTKRWIESSGRYIFEPTIPEWTKYYRGQEGPELYKATGGLYIIRASQLPNLNNQLFNIETIGWELDENSLDVVDIDTQIDLEIAEFLAKKRGIKDQTIRGYFV